MKPPSAETKNETLREQAEAKERRREENAKKAKEFADQLFPGEEWETVTDGIYLSPHRPIGKNSNYKDELRNAQILQALGNIIYLTPENRGDPGKKYDAIVNGQKFEFKNIRGNANTLEMQFLRSRSQAPNVFINLETSNLTGREVMAALYGARNTPRYIAYNRFSGGRIILKIKGQRSLIYLNVDDLKIPGQ